MKKISVLKFLFQFINFAILALAIGLHTTSVYIWSKTDSMNSFILMLVTMGIFVTLSTIFNICWTGNSPCAFLLSKILYGVKLFVTFVLGILLTIDQDMFVQFMKENMNDSTLSINELQKDLNKHFGLIVVLYFLYVSLMVYIT
jgi:hypothetical protein